MGENFKTLGTAGIGHGTCRIIHCGGVTAIHDLFWPDRWDLPRKNDRNQGTIQQYNTYIYITWELLVFINIYCNYRLEQAWKLVDPQCFRTPFAVPRCPPIGVFRNSPVSLMFWSEGRPKGTKKQDASAARQDQNTIEQLMHQKFEIEQEYQAGALHRLDHGEKPWLSA
jgi:hypothetical protein